MFKESLCKALQDQNSSPEQVKNILFDLGGVIVNTQLQRTIVAFQKLGVVDIARYYTLQSQNEMFTQWEKGEISPHAFCNAIRSQTHITATDAEITEAWCAMVLDFPTS